MIAMVLGGPLPQTASTVPFARPVRADPAPDARAPGVARLVGGLIGYAHWPQPRTALTLCRMGTTRLGGELGDAGGIARLPIVLRDLAPGTAAAPQGCDILYLGAMPTALQQKAIMAIHGQPVLSIAEDDPDCRSGAMFCLVERGEELSFRLNLDAVSRGTVRIDPRVLRLFADDGGRP